MKSGAFVATRAREFRFLGRHGTLITGATLRSAMLRLEPMTEEDFARAIERAIPRHAANSVRRGEWAEASALEESRREYAARYPQGVHTRNQTFLNIVEASTGTRVGETWYVSEELGGKVRFWVHWIWIDPEFRRRGYAKEVLAQLEREAVRRGADRMGLYVFNDNRDALDLYTKVGYVTQSMGMVKRLKPPG